MDALKKSATDDSVFTVITGNGDFFSSGIDLGGLLHSSPEDIKSFASSEKLQYFIQQFIDFPKPLVAVVNGPAIGIFATLLGLFDIVFATERATFQTPFSQLGQCPEGCSTITFPLMMGPAKATEMLLFNKKLTARQACDLGLVNEIFSECTFQQEVWAKLKEYATFPKESLAFSKQLIRGAIKEALFKACAMESDMFIKRWMSDECRNAMGAFFQKKAKL
ncbi:enoyl-CoA delta isomerase 2-like [Discoglossus pictus]